MAALINRFPPLGGGGYGLRFSEVLAELARRGHRTGVVTSTHGLAAPRVEGDVHRVLSIHGEIHGAAGVARLAWSSLADGRALRRSLRALVPEVLLVGNFFGLSSALWNVLRRSGTPLVLDVSNEWLLDLCSTHGNWFRIFEAPSRSPLRALTKSALGLLLAAGPAALRTGFPGLGASAVYATSPHLAETLAASCPDVPPLSICPSGIDLASFPFGPVDRPVSRLLYVGRLKATKGVMTALEAVDRLGGEFRLTVVGPPDDPAYARDLEARAEAPGLSGRVEFRGPVPRESLPALFAEHDALLFTSEWAEPFSRLVLEALACGIPLVATPRGGTSDVVRDGENGILFAAGDPGSLVAAVRRLAGDDALRRSIVRRGRRDVEENHALGPAVDRIEKVLAAAAEGR